MQRQQETNPLRPRSEACGIRQHLGGVPKKQVHMLRTGAIACKNSLENYSETRRRRTSERMRPNVTMTALSSSCSFSLSSLLFFKLCQFVLSRLTNTRRVSRRKMPHLMLLSSSDATVAGGESAANGVIEKATQRVQVHSRASKLDLEMNIKAKLNPSQTIWLLPERSCCGEHQEDDGLITRQVGGHTRGDVMSSVIN